MKKPNIFDIVQVYGHDPISALQKLGGYYECPKNAAGKRLGLMVGYAGKYQDKNGQEKQYVGDIYANFAKAEEYPELLEQFAFHMEAQMSKAGIPLAEIDVFCGAPMGGICFANIMGLVYQYRRVVYPEKKITALKTGTSREQSTLVFDRHEINRGEKAVIVEDVSNNFSTTKELAALIEKSGGTVVGIVSILNRSTTKENTREEGEKYEYILPDGRAIPVASLARKPFGQYRQDETEEIAGLVALGGVVWKPKNAWSRLMDAMPHAM